MVKLFALPLTTLLLISCADTPDSPNQVAEKYWDAIQQGDTKAAKQYITNSSQKLYDNHINSLQYISIDNFAVDNDKTTVTTIINPEADVPGDEIIFETRLRQENGQWKVDLNNTQVPQTAKKERELQELAEELSTTMQKNVDSMQDVMSEGMNMLNDALREGSEEMGKSMLDAMKELNTKMKESIGKMKERRQQKENMPKDTDGKVGEGLI